MYAIVTVTSVFIFRLCRSSETTVNGFMLLSGENCYDDVALRDDDVP